KKQAQLKFQKIIVIFMLLYDIYCIVTGEKLNYLMHTNHVGIFSKNGGNNCTVKAKVKMEKGSFLLLQHLRRIYIHLVNIFKTVNDICFKQFYFPTILAMM